MIKWLTIKTSPPALDTEIIVKRKGQFVWSKGITSALKFYPSEKWTEQSMLDDLDYDKYDLWSDVT